MRKVLFFALAFAGAVFAEAQTVSSIETNRVYYSQSVTNNAWVKHIITEFWNGNVAPELKDKAGAFVSAANLAALGVAVEDSKRVYEAWMRGFERGCEALSSQIGKSPDHGAFLKLMFPLVPDATRKSVDIFVVSNTYDSVRNRDILWIYCNRELPMKPVVEVPYIYESGFTTNRIVATFSPPDIPTAHWTNTVTISRFGHVYRDCRALYVNRPANLASYPCNLNRHGRWGRAGEGFDWGSIAVTVDGVPTFTGELTNTVQNKVVVINNGGFIEIKDLNAEAKE